jgi:hypothetical protein
MAGATDLGKLVPGFEFLQGLMQNAGASLPGMSQWIAPTLNPEELDKRIQELKTVQFWLEQNARLLATTIQALEVQRMTLSTLQSMNLPMADLRDALTINLPAAYGGSAPAPSSAPAVAAPVAAPPPPSPAPAPGDSAKPAVVDPMQWWGALTQQFTTLAAQAVKDTAADAARAVAAASVPAALPKAAARPAAKPAATAKPAGAKRSPARIRPA